LKEEEGRRKRMTIGSKKDGKEILEKEGKEIKIRKRYRRKKLLSPINFYAYLLTYLLTYLRS
jgi:hypothetical protein